MHFNNAFLVTEIGNSLDGDTTPGPVPRKRLTSEPCLPERLPAEAFMRREARDLAPKAILRQLRKRSVSPTNSEPESPSEPTGRERRASTASAQSSGSTSLSRSPSTRVNNVPWTEPQPFQVFRAVESKDIMFLMEIRDRAFHLLLRKTGDATPLLHAMRIGQSHRDVAIVLLGAFSRYVNHLTDEDIPKPRTRMILKALRANLKLAIDYGLANSQSDLTASFMQVLIMSEGDKWVWDSVSNISTALNAGTAGQPVKAADAAVRKFATRELGKASLIATLEDYVANATVDLLMFGTWSNVMSSLPSSIHAENMPFYYFARDNRVYKAFVERLERHKVAIQTSCSKRTKWQLRLLRTVLEGRNTTYHRKVQLLSDELDNGEGV